MTYLVDTQIFLWFLSERSRFSEKARHFLEDIYSNQFYLSDATAGRSQSSMDLGN